MGLSSSLPKRTFPIILFSSIFLSMAVWAIADLHLCFGAPDKSMELFGPTWHNYTKRIEENWRRQISPEDLVLLPGDISWAMKLEQALKDLEWIDQLPGTKVMIRGNHDYWWSSPSKIRALLPPSLHIIQNDAFHWHDLSIAGSRLWDLPGASFAHYINISGTLPESDEKEDEKIFSREVERLKMSLMKLNPQAKIRLVMTHYPPISAELEDSPISQLMEEYRVDYVLFGHLHQLKKEKPLFGVKNGVHYLLTTADYLDFSPLLILPT